MTKLLWVSKRLEEMFEGIHIVSEYDRVKDDLKLGGYHQIPWYAYYSSEPIDWWKLEFFEKQIQKILTWNGNWLDDFIAKTDFIFDRYPNE